MPSSLPLAVDLDDTLVNTDTLIESTLQLAQQKPWLMLALPFWVLKGKAYAKRQIARRTNINAAHLPYNQPLLSYIKEQHAGGRELILITASDQSMADKVSHHLGLFSTAIGSDGETNLSGQGKADLLNKRFGVKQYSYAANAASDLKVWQHAGSAIVVNASRALEQAAKNLTSLEKVFPSTKKSLKAFIKAMRIHQWLKNLLLFVPLITAHQVMNGVLTLRATIGFLAFSLIASAIYLLNDLLDIESDRAHHSKKHRPFAASTLHPLGGIIGIPLLVIISLVLASQLPTRFVLVLLIYALVNVAYSFYLKQLILVDVVVLASLYALRILAGSAATTIPTSSWLFAFTMFMFLSLALVKRYTELHNLHQQNKHSASGRGYVSTDRPLIAMLGVSSGYLSLLVLALYISSETVKTLYSIPQLLWLLIPLLIYWISRMWLLTYRGEVHEDPVIFAAKDTMSYLVCGLALILLMIAS